MRWILRGILALTLALSISIINAPVSSAEPTIQNVKLDVANPKVGQTVNWLVDADCAGLPIQQVYMQFSDPNGIVGWLNNNYADIKSGAIGTSATVRVPLKITEDAASGLYSVKSVSLTCQNKNGGEYRWSGSLDSISFRLQNDKAPTPAHPKIDKLEVISGKEVKPGEKIRIELSASGQGKLNSANLTLRSPSGFEIQKFYNQYGQAPSGEESKRINTIFEFEVDQDWVGGIYRISRIDIQGYAGIDLSNPNPDDPNPSNSTSVLNRSLSLVLNSNGFQEIITMPKSPIISQPSLALISINVNNPNPTEVLPPEITGVKIPASSVAAGETFEMSVSVDSKNAYLYSLGLTFYQKEKPINGFGCSTDEIQKNPPRMKWVELKVVCQTQRINPIGTYYLGWLMANSTSCNLSLPALYNQENQNCVNPPKARFSGLIFQNGYSSVSQSPTTKTPAPNLLDGSQTIVVTQAKVLQAPKYKSIEIGANEIKIFYPWSYDIVCDYSSTSGSVTSGTNDKVNNVVTITGLKPATDVLLSGTCTALDKAKVSFVESLTTAIPAPPFLPTVISKKQELDSVTVYLSDLNQEGVDYSVKSTKGSVIIAGNTLYVSDLNPGQSTIITMTMKDDYGQETSGIIGTFAALQPPKLTVPTVALVAKSKSSYSFKFLPNEKVTYSVRCTNCIAKLSLSNISVTGFKPGRTASAYLVATDKFGQRAETKFFTGKVNPTKG